MHLPSSFILLHLRRSVATSKAYLIFGLALPLLMTVLFFVIGNREHASALAAAYGLPPSTSGGGILVYTFIPSVIPLAAVIGSFSPLLVFVNDRSRGVYEYLLAFGRKPAEIFIGLVISVIVLSVALIAVPVAVAGSLIYISSGALLGRLMTEILVYSLPVGFVAPLFISAISVMWVSLTKRMQFVNSPIGIAPLFGLLPVVAVLLFAEFDRGANLTLPLAFVAAGMAAATVVLFAIASSALGGERFIV